MEIEKLFIILIFNSLRWILNMFTQGLERTRGREAPQVFLVVFDETFPGKAGF